MSNFSVSSGLYNSGVRMTGMEKGGELEQLSKSSKKSDELRPTSVKLAKEEGQKQIAQDSGHLRRATAVGVGFLTFLRVITAIGTLGISEGIKAAVDKGIENYGTKKTPKEGVEVTLPGTGEKVTLKGSALPARIPKDMTPEQLQQKIQEKVTAGHDLVKGLTNDTLDKNQKCSVKDMTNIMFFLQAKGEAGKGAFPEGAFTLSDPGNRIRNFLDTCPKAYQRVSSHIDEFQNTPGARHRGIDAYGSGKNFDELLPNGMKTLLYGAIPKSDSMKVPEDRLYLKIESHGAWLSRPKGGGDEGGPRRLGNHHDVGAFLGHTFSFVGSIGQDNAAGMFKERLPGPVKNSYNALIEQSSGSVKEKLTEGNPTSKSSGIRVMLANVQAALDELGDKDPGLKQQLEKFQSDITQKYDHCNLRIGNEIIFTAGDFA